MEKYAFGQNSDKSEPRIKITGYSRGYKKLKSNNSIVTKFGENLNGM